MAKVSASAAPAAAVSSAPASGGGLAITASASPSSAPEHEEGAAYSTEDVMKLFEEGGDEPDVTEEGMEGTDPAPGEGEEQGGEEEKQDMPEYPMPEGWEDAMWQGMGADVRGKVDAMVKAHAEALASKEKAMRDAEAQHKAQAMKANAEMQTSLNIMRAVVEGEFRGIDWQGLSATDPAMYVELQKQYQQRMGAIQQMQQRVAQQSAQLAQAQAAEAQAAMQNELATVLPKVKALMGAGYTGETYRAELAQYLEKSGVPMEAIGNITKGYELELATKAMLWDKQQQAREAASAKVASIPAVQSPRGAAAVDDGDRLKSARARLNKNPNSTEALAALFAAM
jgi:hypothetical protein